MLSVPFLDTLRSRKPCHEIINYIIITYTKLCTSMDTLEFHFSLLHILEIINYIIIRVLYHDYSLRFAPGKLTSILQSLKLDFFTVVVDRAAHGGGGETRWSRASSAAAR